MSDWESGLDKEIRFHLEQAVSDYMADGMPEAEARAKARREFGSVDLAKEEVRDTLPMRWLRDLVQDLRYALRSHGKSRGVAIVAVLTLALGIGAAISIFSVVYAVLLKSLPYPDAVKLVYVWSPNANLTALPKEMPPSNATYYNWQRLNHSFEELAMFYEKETKLDVEGGVQKRVDTIAVTGNLFHTLGTAPMLGRTIEPEDDQPEHDRVAVISDNFWRSSFSAARDVLGKTIRLDSRDYRVIGVMPPSFGFPMTWETPKSTRSLKRNEIWTPLALSPKERANEGIFAGIGDGTVIGRLRPGVSFEHAQTEMSAIMKQLVAGRDPMSAGAGTLLISLTETAFGAVRQQMLLLLAIVGIVLLIMCGNVANLLLARYSGRAHEMGVRSALGADRSRLIRLIAAESLLLSVAGGALGTALAMIAIRTLVKLAPASLPRVLETKIDLPVLLFALGASLATGLLCGLLPAWTASRTTFLSMLQAGGTRGVLASSRIRRVLIAGEVALSLILITGAGLFIRSYVQLAKEGPGFSGEVLSTSIRLPEQTPPEKLTATYRKILADLEARPEVIAAGANTNLPLSGSGTIGTLAVEGRSEKEPLSVHQRGASPDYFQTMGIAVLEGRAFEDRDYGRKTGVVIASEGFAKQYFPGQSALGKHVSNGPGNPWEEIVGVVRDVKNYDLEEAPLGEIYRPLDRMTIPRMFFVVRSRIPAEQMSSIVREIVLAQRGDTQIDAFETMADRTWRVGAERRFDTSLLSGFALMALLLAVVGLFGLVAHSVRMRTQEIGLRMALGASRGNVFAMVLKQGFRLLAAGAVVGIAGSWAVTRLLDGLLYGVGATDPVTFLGAPLLLIATGLAACAIPGLRASHIDPAVALRNE